MGTVVNLDPDLEERLRKEARDQNVDFDRVLNEVVRAGLAPSTTGKGRRFVQKTYSMGVPRIDLTKALTLAGELEDEEIIGKMRPTEQR
jgi:hypothetical protein